MFSLKNVLALSSTCLLVVLLSIFYSPSFGHSAVLSDEVAFTTDPKVKKGSGSIVMTDIILIATATNSSHKVVKLELFSLKGVLIHTFNGCNFSKCSYDLRSLPTGAYKAVATTNVW